MKIQIFRKKQSLSFLPVTISLNDSLFRPLTDEGITEFETDKSKATFILNIMGMKREIALDLEPASSVSLEMHLSLDKNQRMLVTLGFIAAIFLMIAGVVNKNMLQIIISASTFIGISLVTLYHSIQINIKTLQ